MNITVEIQKQGKTRRDYLQWIDAEALKIKEDLIAQLMNQQPKP